MHHQNPDKFQFKFSAILCLRQKLLLASEKALLWTVIFSKWPRCWNQVEYNRRAAIINHQRPSRSSIIFWISEINRLWCCDKIYSFKTIQRRYLYATEEESLEKSIARTPAVIESANFEWSKAIVAKISIDCWCKRANNALARLHCRWRLPSIQIVHIKDITDALWGCQDKTSCSPRLPFWPPNSPDLNPLDYYVWSVIERITNKSLHPNVTSLRTAYWGSIRRHGQRYITACVRLFQTENRGRHSS